MRQTVRGWRLPRQTFRSLVELADQCNPTIRGWWNYYGAFYRTAMQGLGLHASSHAGPGASTKRYDGINGVATSGRTR
ncbi:group II intron maturase-specific domain-containing protein [Paraburkholderia sediminicola]|uniref:group II intron maturase-specific domain-containing protein n=1 Tax=Paraburkholderia sediminicola TaxID=458836 RepID=UPI0038BD3CA3